MRGISSISLVIAAAVALTGVSCADDAAVEVSDTESSASTTMVPTSVFEASTTTEAVGASSAKQAVFAFTSPDDVSGWNVVNDSVMGGVSTGRLSWEDGALVFSGELSRENNGGFASVRSPIIDTSLVARWSEAGGLGVEARGDGRVWTVEVRIEGEEGGWISELAVSTGDFIEVELPWESFEPVTRFLDPRTASVPLEPSRILSVAFYLVDGIEAPFRLELRSIS